MKANINFYFFSLFISIMFSFLVFKYFLCYNLVFERVIWVEKIYVFGHRNPDTDSITAAISLSYLKQQLGLNTIPVTLSNINNETKFALKYFNVKEPIFLNDIKFKLKDVKYKKNLNINICETLINAYNLMIRENSSKLSVA